MNKLLIFPLLILTIAPSFSQNFTISGVVSDATTGENIIGANVYEANTLEGTVTNPYGFYSLKLREGNVNIVFSYIGYKTTEISIDLDKNKYLAIQLEPVIELEGVTITDKGPQKTVQSVQMSTVELPIIKAKQLPVLLGEVDVIKALQLMPGVQSGTEGSSGIYVRGGGPDQNLILLDGVPVYNVNHLFGFFSVFNADAIKSVSLIKGGFPARYGGRLSSVLDIRMKDGNMKEFHGEGSIGLISSKLTLEGPIVKDRASFIISGRRTYLDILSLPFQRMANNQYNNGKFYVGYYFTDINAKVNYKISGRDRLYLSSYIGKDKFYVKDKYKSEYEDYEYDEQGGLKWGNITSALRWNHIFGNNLFSNLTLTFSDYTFKTYYEGHDRNLEDNDWIEDNYSFVYYSRIRDFGVRYDFDYSLGIHHDLKYGISNTLHIFSPGVAVYKDDPDEYTEEIDTTFGDVNIPSNEFYVYAEDEISIGNKLKINIGIHYSNFSMSDSLYHSFEPRISARYLINDNISLKASYVRMTQYLNLLTNSGIGLPTDLWVPATKRIHPQKAWQAATGIAVGIGDKYELTLEGFYKQMNNLVEYSEGASFFSLNSDWEDLVTQGKGESYGAELFIQKVTGRTSGWIGYTLSWSNRKFDEVSFGRTFPYKYDRRHDVSVVMTHAFNDRIDVGLTWVFGTGHALTITDEKFSSHEYYQDLLRNKPDYIQPWYYDEVSGRSTGYFETRNSYRMPNYHRLDIGINMHKEKRWGKRTWSCGVYNTYARQNPFYIYYTEEYNYRTEEYEPVLKQVSLLTYIPYVRYSFTF